MVSVSLTFQSVRVETDSRDQEGQLVFANSFLVAVLVRLDPVQHPEKELQGQWYLEVGFGRCAANAQTVFPTLDAVQAWVQQRWTKQA